MKKLLRLLNFLPLLTLTLSFVPVPARASFERDEAAMRFVQEMADQHGFESQDLLNALKRARYNADVIRLITPPSKRSQRSWQRYRSRFVVERRIADGVKFWQQHHETIARASATYGVPEEIIVAIIGVETHYGSNTGNFETVSALATLAFNYPPRADLFRKELEALFLLAREQDRDPFSFTGSYAGALGYPQFLPSSIRAFAVDFDNNGRIDFDSDPTDAIGSVANYLAVHGWLRSEPVAVQVALPAGFDPTPMIDAGIEPTLEVDLLKSTGLNGIGAPLHSAPATLVDLETPDERTEYWLGYRNFYVITRYNRSSFYAMSVYQLADAVSRRYRDTNTVAKQ